jgi:hypothetical protein
MKTPIEIEAEEVVGRLMASLIARIEMLEHQVDKLERWKDNLANSSPRIRRRKETP